MQPNHPFFEHDGLLAFAHRGGAEEAPENTMAAFQAAVDLGYRYLETDAYATADNVLLSFHDDSLDRVTDRIGRIEELPYSEIKQARVQGAEPIPLMEDLLGAWDDVCLNIDAKHDQAVEPLIRLIQRTNALDRICVGSFSGKRLDRLRAALGPGLCTSMTPFEVTRLRIGSVGLPTGKFQAHCAQVPMSHKGIPIVTNTLVTTANKCGVQVHVWTIDDPDTMDQLVDLGVHGIMTDRPSILKNKLVEKGRWPC